MTAQTGQTTLTIVQLAATQRADMVSSNFVTSAEWITYIQASYQELYGLLAQKYGNDYFVAGTPDNWYQFTTTTAAGYALPDGSTTYKLVDTSTTAPAFFKLLGVDLYTGAATSPWLKLKPFPFGERGRRGAYTGMRSASNLRYRVFGQYLELDPQPVMSGQILRLWYVPRLTLPTTGTDIFDGVNGWEEFIVVDAAIKALQKEESDVSVLMAQKQAIIHRIESEAENRDAGSPATVADVRGNMYGSMPGYYPGDF